MPISFAARVLVSIAERRLGTESLGCRLALLHSESAVFIHRCLRRALLRHRLSDLQFAVLIILFSTEPEPLSASVLAEHACVSRPAITDALDKLEAAQFVTRSRTELDRRISFVRITPAGQVAVDRAITDYLHTADHCVRGLQPKTRRALCDAFVGMLRTLAASDLPPAEAALP